eukprot:g36602.t1
MRRRRNPLNRRVREKGKGVVVAPARHRLVMDAGKASPLLRVLPLPPSFIFITSMRSEITSFIFILIKEVLGMHEAAQPISHIACFYLLPKIHKLDCLDRPIVSAISCSTELISSYPYFLCVRCIHSDDANFNKWASEIFTFSLNRGFLSTVVDRALSQSTVFADHNVVPSTLGKRSVDWVTALQNTYVLSAKKTLSFQSLPLQHTI